MAKKPKQTSAAIDTDVFDVAPAASDSSIDSLVKSANELADLERKISELEALEKAMRSRAHELKTSVIPDKMGEVGLDEFKTPEGVKLALEDFVSGSLPKEPAKRVAAISELERAGGEAIIKNALQLEFEKSQHNEALGLAEQLRDQGFPVVVSSSVHPQTYLAFVREKLKTGEAIDTEALGVFVGRRVKISGV